MTQEVIYARVPTALKEAADAYARRRGTTMTSAVIDLLHRGLSAVDSNPVRHLETELAEVTSRLRAAEGQLATLTAFADRASRRVGACPACGQEITGRDLLAVGCCGRCAAPLSGLLVPDGGETTLDQREALLLVGALGSVLAVAYLAAGKPVAPLAAQR